MSEPTTWVAPVLQRRQELAPIATEISPILRKLPEVRAVVFDVYGTLVISGTGEVGSADRGDGESSDAGDDGSEIRAAMNAVGWFPDDSDVPTIQQLHQQIRCVHDGWRSDDCPKPEIDVVDVWRQTFATNRLEEFSRDTPRLVAFAAEYESRTNPTWPMPGAKELIRQISAAGLPIGIVSNAQVFTPQLVDELAARADGESVMELDLCIYSYRYRQAKPGPRLFAALADALQRKGISPQEAVYVGNDMLNDVWAARQAGLRTAWFAGDDRSCRARANDPRCRSLQGDVVLTNLLQLLDCLVFG